MSANRGRDTKPEIELRRLLHAQGLRFFVNRRPVPTLRRTADVVFPRLRIAVFVDGCFWHGCPEHHTFSKTNPEYWANKVAANRQRDAETNRLLWSEGWLVLRYWEHTAPEVAAAEIARAVASAR